MVTESLKYCVPPSFRIQSVSALRIKQYQHQQRRKKGKTKIQYQQLCPVAMESHTQREMRERKKKVSPLRGKTPLVVVSPMSEWEMGKPSPPTAAAVVKNLINAFELRRIVALCSKNLLSVTLSERCSGFYFVRLAYTTFFASILLVFFLSLLSRARARIRVPLLRERERERFHLMCSAALVF